MNNDKPKKVIRTTPRGTFIFPKLSTPDTKFKPEGEFSTKLSLATDSEYAQKLMKLIDKTCDEALAEAIKGDTRDAAKKKKTPWKLNESKPYAAETDKEGNETGNTLFKFGAKASGTFKRGPKTGQSWSRTIPMFDSKGKPVKVDPWGGSEGCVSYEVRPYAATANVGAGCVLALEAVQIIKLVKGGERDAGGFGFQASEDSGGFSADDVVDETKAGAGEEGDDAPSEAGNAHSAADDF